MVAAPTDNLDHSLTRDPWPEQPDSLPAFLTLRRCYYTETANAPSFDLGRDGGICRGCDEGLLEPQGQAQRSYWSPQAEPRGLAKVLQRSITT